MKESIIAFKMSSSRVGFIFMVIIFTVCEFNQDIYKFIYFHGYYF